MRRHRAAILRPLTTVLLFALGAWASAADPPAEPPAATGSQFAIAVLPDPQAYTQCYDVTLGGEKWGSTGCPYKDRFDRQVQWIVDNRRRYNIRLAVDVGDNVQHFGFDAAKAAADPNGPDGRRLGEWLNAQHSLNLFHEGADPTRPALLPYAVATGNHDYHSPGPGDLASPEFLRFFGPGRWKTPDGAVRPAFAEWFGGDDAGWKHQRDGRTLAVGVGRNSFQVFSAAGRKFLHLTLECGVTDEAIAWARQIIQQHPGRPTILTTHSFLGGNGALQPPEKMGRLVAKGANPTNGAQAVFDKLVRDNDQVFLILCGHTYSQEHKILTNAAGHDVHVMLACYHLNYDGGRIQISQKPPGGWAYEGTADDADRNGCGWLRLLVFDPDAKRIAAHTCSPVLGLWAADRKPDVRRGPDAAPEPAWNRTFPTGDDVVEQFDFDFAARFGAPPPAP